MSNNEEQNLECPLCMEPLEMDDINFFPCTCGYQICRFCWHRIRTDENGLCPACRKQYPEDPADFKPLSMEELQKIKSEKKQKDLQRKHKISESRKHLSNVRVVQQNLVFVIGLPPRLADAETLKKHEYFGKFGKIHKVVVNSSPANVGSQMSHSHGTQNSSAYVTYLKADDALRAIQSVNNIHVDNRTLKASLGTTKYCSHFLKNQQCPKTDCMYLHELGDDEASFTKEEMQQGKHQEYEKKLHEQMLSSTVLPTRKQTPSPVSQQTPKELWPSLEGDRSKRERPENESPKSQSTSVNCSKEEPKGESHSLHQDAKCRHSSGEDLVSYRSKKGRERHTVDKLVKGCKERTHKPNSSSSVNPGLHHTGTQDSTSAQSLSTGRLSSCGSSSGTDSSVHSSTNSLNCPAEPHLAPWPSPSQSELNCVNPNAVNSSGSLSPSFSESPVQSTPFGSLSSSNAAPSPPLHTGDVGAPPEPQGLESSCHMGDLLSSYPVNRTSLQLPSYQDSFLTHPMTAPQHAPLQTRLTHVPAPGKMDNGLAPSEMYRMNGVNRLQNGDWLRTGPILPPTGDIPVNNSPDWQAAFGFGAHQKSQDDDLGFDPWDESSKGLADLLEKEAVKRSLPHAYPFPSAAQSQILQQQLLLKQQQLQMLGNPHFSNGFDQVHGTALPQQQQEPRRVGAPPGFAPNHVNAFPSLNRLSLGSDKSTVNSKLLGQHPLDSCSGAPFFSSTPQDDLQTSQLRPGVSGHFNQQSTMFAPPQPFESKLSDDYVNNMKDWQDGLRSLLPNISISFGPAPSQPSPTVPDGPMPQKISGRESPPHWMKSLQQLTLEDGSVAYGNHHIPHSPLFAYRGGIVGNRSGGLPPFISSGGAQGPPPGFTTPLRSCETHKVTENL